MFLLEEGPGVHLFLFGAKKRMQDVLSMLKLNCEVRWDGVRPPATSCDCEPTVSGCERQIFSS